MASSQVAFIKGASGCLCLNIHWRTTAVSIQIASFNYLSPLTSSSSSNLIKKAAIPLWRRASLSYLSSVSLFSPSYQLYSAYRYWPRTSSSVVAVSGCLYWSDSSFACNKCITLILCRTGGYACWAESLLSPEILLWSPSDDEWYQSYDHLLRPSCLCLVVVVCASSAPVNRVHMMLAYS